MGKRDRVVVVTGASSGIGRACALRFAERVGGLVLVARRAAALEELATECRGRGSEVLVAAVDVTDAEAVDRVAAQAVARFGRVDVWVNNAAVNLYGRTEEVPARLWHRVVQTNLFGTYHGVRAVLPWFREQGGGTLINVSSVLGHTGFPQQSAYAASKHGIRALGDCVRQEVRDVDGISVCTVLPGPVDTPLFRVAGNWTGRRVVPPGQPVPADRVAAAVLRCADRPRREVPVGGASRAGVLAARIAPGLVERAGARVLGRQHFADEATAPTEGNLFEPADFGARVDDGWRSGVDGRRRRGAKALLGAGLLLGAALVSASRAATTSRGRTRWARR
ncbi:SDR family NAD(P)-dependent oxidoreductase [Micromonospora radicis]|uniref:SDR family NAD(P)-dependent oxidoreductase n=1 Tax=Micromonospora radicis TaxID=1894971 RepID=A0A418MYW0_9ACTN|nr:SDR family NAD(P)-dependent oxidoreductase [Micromonospora radicis]RIV39960.1 SDR family NAD(P)-dependent oxidoreductase [Micromonospora radicis]